MAHIRVGTARAHGEARDTVPEETFVALAQALIPIARGVRVAHSGEVHAVARIRDAAETVAEVAHLALAHSVAAVRVHVALRAVRGALVERDALHAITSESVDTLATSADADRFRAAQILANDAVLRVGIADEAVADVSYAT